MLNGRKGIKFLPTVEMIQDFVEKELMTASFTDTAKEYILYRNRRSELRAAFGPVSEAVRKAVEESSKYFSSPYSEYIFYQFYSRWVSELGRRETWVETIDRYMTYMKENLGNKLSLKEYEEVRQAILNQDICPSMRLLWSAGNQMFGHTIVPILLPLVRKIWEKLCIFQCAEPDLVLLLNGKMSSNFRKLKNRQKKGRLSMSSRIAKKGGQTLLFWGSKLGLTAET